MTDQKQSPATILTSGVVEDLWHSGRYTDISHGGTQIRLSSSDRKHRFIITVTETATGGTAIPVRPPGQQGGNG